MRIAVTGGTGFIGTHVVSLLVARGHDVLALTCPAEGDVGGARGGPRYLAADLGDSADLEVAMRGHRPDAMVHLAWEGLPDYSAEICQRNVEYGANVFSAAVRSGCSAILSVGSCWEYADLSGQLAEDDEPELGKPFPAAKNAIRETGRTIAEDSGMAFYWLRLFFVYGPGQRPTSLIPHIIESARDSQSPDLRSPGSRNDFIFVADVARAIVDVIERRPSGKVYNIGTGGSVAVRDVVRCVYEAMGKTPDPAFVEDRQADSGEDFWADVSRIRRDIGWRATHDIESGIRATIEASGAGC